MDLDLSRERGMWSAPGSRLFVERRDDDLDPAVLEALGKLQDELPAYELFGAAFDGHVPPVAPQSDREASRCRPYRAWNCFLLPTRGRRFALAPGYRPWPLRGLFGGGLRVTGERLRSEI
ncbi:MAG TPA: hypothetical protein DD490_10120 [Acidobacteria bacterium]|nr:hypothetical protein [Acidobacteriota bacterium]